MEWKAHISIRKFTDTHHGNWELTNCQIVISQPFQSWVESAEEEEHVELQQTEPKQKAQGGQGEEA